MRTKLQILMPTPVETSGYRVRPASSTPRRKEVEASMKTRPVRIPALIASMLRTPLIPILKEILWLPMASKALQMQTTIRIINRRCRTRQTKSNKSVHRGLVAAPRGVTSRRTKRKARVTSTALVKTRVSFASRSRSELSRKLALKWTRRRWTRDSCRGPVVVVQKSEA